MRQVYLSFTWFSVLKYIVEFNSWYYWWFACYSSLSINSWLWWPAHFTRVAVHSLGNDDFQPLLKMKDKCFSLFVRQFGVWQSQKYTLPKTISFNYWTSVYSKGNLIHSFTCNSIKCHFKVYQLSVKFYIYFMIHLFFYCTKYMKNMAYSKRTIQFWFEILKKYIWWTNALEKTKKQYDTFFQGHIIREANYRKRKRCLGIYSTASMKSFWIRSESWIKELRIEASQETIAPCVWYWLQRQLWNTGNRIKAEESMAIFLTWFLQGSLCLTNLLDCLKIMHCER